MELSVGTQYLIRFKTRDNGHGPEKGSIVGRWSGIIDAWGKHTINGSDGSTHYLFRDEIKSTLPVPEPFDALPLFARFRFRGSRYAYVKAATDAYHFDVSITVRIPELCPIVDRPKAKRNVIRLDDLPNIAPPASRWIEWRKAVNATISAERGANTDRAIWAELQVYYRTNYHPAVAAREWMRTHPW